MKKRANKAVTLGKRMIKFSCKWKDNTVVSVALNIEKVCHVLKKHKALKKEIKGFTKNVFNLSISSLYKCLQFIAAVSSLFLLYSAKKSN